MRGLLYDVVFSMPVASPAVGGDEQLACFDVLESAEMKSFIIVG